jgi:hypothetical protein
MLSRYNSLYTDTLDRLTIYIGDPVFLPQTHWQVIWNTIYQYNNIKMPDNCRRAMTALGWDNQASASGLGLPLWPIDVNRHPRSDQQHLINRCYARQSAKVGVLTKRTSMAIAASMPLNAAGVISAPNSKPSPRTQSTKDGGGSLPSI